MNSQIRIIAGKWRGRKIKFEAIDSLRPTPDRVRETLFNWLYDVNDSTCLDMFAGSGALGIECLSRGASSVTFIEKNQTCCNNIAQAIKGMRDNIKYEIHNSSFEQSLAFLEGKQFDLIFLDPPYHSPLLEQAITSIVDNNLLAKDGLIYCESAKDHNVCYLPDLEIFKTKTYGHVTFSLLKIKDKA